MIRMSFQENLLRKIELEKLAARVTASIGTGQSRHPVDKESMRRLLELSPYQYQHERDLDLYVKSIDDTEKLILVLDNELPIFRSTVKDVVTRRSPRTLEMWKISTIRKILNDSDVKLSTREESVGVVLEDAITLLDLTYTDADIEKMTREGMAWLAGTETGEVRKSLSLFAELLGYRKPPKYFNLDQTISYGQTTTGPDDDVVLGPLVLYRPADNFLAWIDQLFSRSEKKQMEFLHAVATGHASVPVTGDAVFQKLQAVVLEQPGHVSAIYRREK